MDRTLLNNATSPYREPVNGYHLSQITQLSYSTPDACLQLEEYLLNRLQRDNPNTKFKTLRVIRHLAEKGKPDFKRSIRRKAEPIKAYQTFQGTFDSIHGDSLGKQIREEALKCLTTIFSDETNDSINQSLAHRISGIGSSKSDIHTETPHYTSESHRGSTQLSNSRTQRGKYIGVGNPNFDHNFPSYPQSGYASSALKALNEVADRYFPSVKDTIIKSSNIFSNPGPDQYQERRSQNYYNNTYNKGTSGSAYHEQRFTYPTVREAMPSNEYETKLVDNLLAPGGVLPTIPTASLDSFMVKCRSLDLEVIGNILYQRFMQKDSDETTKARCLIIIGKLLSTEDHLITQQRYTLENFVKEKFLYNLKEIINKSDSKPEIKEKSANILKLLNIDFDSSKVQVKEPEENLFDFISNDANNDKKSETKSTTIDDLFSTIDGSNPSNRKEKVDDFNLDFFDSRNHKDNCVDSESEAYLDIFEANNLHMNQTAPDLELNTPTLFENLTPHPQPLIKFDKPSKEETNKFVSQFGNFIYTSEQAFPPIQTHTPAEEDFNFQLDDQFGFFVSSNVNIPKVESYPSMPKNNLNTITNVQDAFITELFGNIAEKPKSKTETHEPFSNFADF